MDLDTPGNFPYILRLKKESSVMNHFFAKEMPAQ